jgi:hypothetical protein
MYESNDKMVSHPPHYQSETGLEVIDVIEAFTFDLKGIEATDTGNVIKYICRWKGKNGLQDLEKAKWYLEHLIDHVSKLEEENKPIDNAEPAAEDTVGYDHPIVVPFKTTNKANECLYNLRELIKTYGFANIADIGEYSGLSYTYGDETQGWTNLDDVKIDRHVGEHHNYATLTLPKPVPIK